MWQDTQSSALALAWIAPATDAWQAKHLERYCATAVPAARMMRIVTTGAGEPSLTLAEAHRLSQPVSLTDDFELVLQAGRGWLVKVHRVGAQLLAWPERIWLALESADHARQFRASSFQMTLHTDIHLQFRTQTRRVDDR